MLLNYRKKLLRTHGQGLLETIIALGIMTTAVFAAITLGFYSYHQGKISEDRLIAVNLAREGIEVARNIRDTNWLNGRFKVNDTNPINDWDFNLKTTGTDHTAILNFDSDHNLWSLDFNSNGNSDVGYLHINDSTECPCYYNAPLACRIYRSANGIYSQDANGTATKYYRSIWIIPDITDPNQKQIVSQVVWGPSGNLQNVTLISTLTNWH